MTASHRATLRSTLRSLAAACVAATCATAAAAQAGARYSLVGVAFDSLRTQPFAMAIVTIEGVGQPTFTDAAGRFRFDSLAAGTYRIVVGHETLDSLGLGPVTAEVTVRGPADTVRVFGPSLAVLWHRACGGADPPRDSALVFGAVRNAVSGESVPDASVHVTWVEAGVEGGKLTPFYIGGAVQAGVSGAYAVCGVPAGEALRVYAAVGGSRSGMVDLPAPAIRAKRFDVWLALPADSTRRGQVTGIVRDDQDQPLAGITVRVEGAADAVSDAGGRFAIRAPLGSRQVIAASPGTTAATVPVIVRPAEPASVLIALKRAPHTH